MITSLNYLHKTKKPGNFQETTLPLATQRALGRLGDSASAYVRGLTEDSVQCFDSLIRDLRSPAATYATQTDALDIIADAVSLPADKSSVSLIDVLPPCLKSVYRQPNPSLFRPPVRRPSGRYAKMVGSTANYAAFVRRLLLADMVDFTKKPLCVNGLFAVSKPDGSQRFIVDCRPANELFVDSPAMSLPTPDVLAKLQLPPDTPVYSTKADLDNCFHRYRTPLWLRPYLCLPPVLAEDVGMTHVYPAGTVLYPQCTTLPMGWAHSAALVQASSEYSIVSMPSFDARDQITAVNDFRLDRPRYFVYIDDFVILGVDPARLRVLLEEYQRSMTLLAGPPYQTI